MLRTGDFPCNEWTNGLFLFFVFALCSLYRESKRKTYKLLVAAYSTNILLHKSQCTLQIRCAICLLLHQMKRSNVFRYNFTANRVVFFFCLFHSQFHFVIYWKNFALVKSNLMRISSFFATFALYVKLYITFHQVIASSVKIDGAFAWMMQKNEMNNDNMDFFIDILYIYAFICVYVFYIPCPLVHICCIS